MTDTSRVERVWKRIEAWLEKHAPAIHASLGEGASPAAIDAIVKEVGALPADLEASCRIHDGQPWERGTSPPHLMAYRDTYLLLSLSAIEEEWRSKRRSPSRIPIAKANSGECIYMQLGTGKITRGSHEGGGGAIADSFAAWLEAHADALEAGTWKVGGDGWLEPAD
jgi:cell wall assembly regulator SMI1